MKRNHLWIVIFIFFSQESIGSIEEDKRKLISIEKFKDKIKDQDINELKKTFKEIIEADEKLIEKWDFPFQIIQINGQSKVFDQLK